jgi:hypothetical protein
LRCYEKRTSSLEELPVLENIIFGFIIPWLFGVWLYMKQPKIVLLSVPIGSAISFTLNQFGFNYFWEFHPHFKNLSFSALPLDLGVYPVLSSFFIYYIHKKSLNRFLIVLLFSFFTTGGEWIVYMLQKVTYLNHWNIFWTYISYTVGYSFVYLYYRVLFKYKIID